MSAFETFTIILTALTLIVTVVGWAITARGQRRLLTQQMEATEKLTRIPLRSARRAEQFNRVADWFSETEKLRRLAQSLPSLPSKKEELTTRFLEWEEIYTTEILQVAAFLDAGLANAVRIYYGHVNLFVMYAVNGHLEDWVDAMWMREMSSAKESLQAKLNELNKAIVDE